MPLWVLNWKTQTGNLDCFLEHKPCSRWSCKLDIFINTCFHWRVQCNSLGCFHSYGNSIRVLIPVGPSWFRKIRDVWIVFLRSCMSGWSSQTSPTRILNLLKKSRHIALQIPVLHPVFVIIQPFALGYASMLPLLIHTPRSLQSGVNSVVWEQHQGAVPKPMLNTHMDTAWDEAHSWVCAPCWSVETHLPVRTRALKSTSQWCHVFSKSQWLHLMSS